MKLSHLVFAAIGFTLSACDLTIHVQQDGNSSGSVTSQIAYNTGNPLAPISSTPPSPQQPPAPHGMTFVTSISYGSQPLNAVAMHREGNKLYLSGYPFGLMAWDVSNAEMPAVDFSVADNITGFSPIGLWHADDVASGAIAVDGNLLLTSGTKGLSVVDISSKSHPQEIGRYPGIYPDGLAQMSDSRFEYRAIVTNGAYYYGFRQQDYVATASIQPSAIGILRQDSYSVFGSAGLVTSAAKVGNNIYVAFTNAFAVFQINTNGTLTAAAMDHSTHATYVAEAGGSLYVQVAPGSPNPPGIYVYDQQHTQTAYYSAPQFVDFAVTEDGSHLIGNRTGQSLEVYRLQ